MANVSDPRERYLIRYAGSFAPFVVGAANGSWMTTTDGRHVLDFTSGQICSTIGHNHPRIAQAMREVAENGALHLNSWMLSEPVLELGRRLAEVVPAPLERSILLNTGTESTDVGLRLAKMHTGRFEVVALTRSFHGLLSGMSSHTYSVGHAGYGPGLPGFALPAPYAYRCPISHCRNRCDATCLEAGFGLIDQQSVGSLAAVIVEPVLSAGGVIVPPEGWFPRLREMAAARGMLLVIDEAQTGFGRMGTMFAFEQEGVVPDILAVSKTLGGGLPLAATITSGEIAEDVERKGFMHITSHVSDPLPAAVGLAVLDVIAEEGLVDRARTRGDYLLERLRELQERHEQIGDVRGRGLLVGIELVEDRESRRPADELGMAVMNRTLDHGLSMNIVRTRWGANCFRMAPPLSVSTEEIDTAMDIIDQSLREVLAGV
jgi:2,2-dialkylglycine decarboxylase (pyruvate)